MIRQLERICVHTAHHGVDACCDPELPLLHQRPDAREAGVGGAVADLDVGVGGAVLAVAGDELFGQRLGLDVVGVSLDRFGLIAGRAVDEPDGVLDLEAGLLAQILGAPVPRSCDAASWVGGVLRAAMTSPSPITYT